MESPLTQIIITIGGSKKEPTAIVKSVAAAKNRKATPKAKAKTHKNNPGMPTDKTGTPYFIPTVGPYVG